MNASSWQEGPPEQGVPHDAVAVERSIVGLLRRLVCTPSRAGLDGYEPILGILQAWLGEQHLNPRRLQDSVGNAVGLVVDVVGAQPGPHYVLNACVDTAPYGDERAWDRPPTSGVVVDGWLHGRGSADCKAAVAIFCHLAVALQSEVSKLAGTLTVLFDADEHTGRFGGAKAYFGNGSPRPDVAGVMIGYPGDEWVVVGSRGFLRARLTVSGTARHSGTSSTATDNAVEKAALLVRRLGHVQLPHPLNGDFPLPPKLTVTAIHGGEGFTIVPDICTVDVDVRLTPAFTAEQAADLLTVTAAQVDARQPSRRATAVRLAETWPAYQLDAGTPLVAALTTAAATMGGHGPVRTRVVGPSNIGNYLAALGIDATAGFGVRYRNLHAANECIDLSTVPMVFAAYREAVTALLRAL